MTLILHRGAKDCDFDTLRALPTPARTETHVPLAHSDLVSMVKYGLGYFGHEIEDEAHGVTEDGMDYFGLLTLRSPYGNYVDTLGLRNSNAKRFPIGIAYGAKTLVCDNLSFCGDTVIKRKHTANSKRELPSLIAEIIEPLRIKREQQHEKFITYQATPVNQAAADHAILTMFREGVINTTRIPEVLGQFENPAHDWGDKTAWRLFNSATFALAGKVAEEPSLTKRLHAIIDGVCTVH